MATTTESAAGTGPAAEAGRTAGTGSAPEAGPTSGASEQTALPMRLRQLRWSTWRGVIFRSVMGWIDDNCGDWAAALTYYAVLALFPSAIVIVSLVGLVADGQEAVNTIIDIGRDLGAGSIVANDSFLAVVNGVIQQQSSAKALLSFGLIGALWSASNFVASFTRASNAIYHVEEGRPVWKLRPVQIGLTAIALVLMAAVAAGLVISGPVADAVGNALDIGDTPRTLWTFGRWPVLVAILMLLLSLLFWIAPNVQQPRFRWLTVGGAFALFVWALASAGFGVYVANFGSYDKTYGSIGAIIAFLVWLYLANSALMLGVEINAELQRGRQMQAGKPDPDPPLPPKTPATS